MFWKNWKKLEKSLPCDLETDFFMPKDMGVGSDKKALFEKCAYAYACITATANAIASLGVKLEREEGGVWVSATEEAEDIGAKSLIRYPCGKKPTPPQLSWHDLTVQGISNLLIFGRAYLLPQFVERNSRIYKVLPLLDGQVQVENNKEGYPESYIIGGKAFPPTKIIHAQTISPFDFSGGLGAIKPAVQAIQTDLIASRRVKANLQNKAAVGLILRLKGVFTAGEEQRKKILENLRENYQAASQDGTPFVVSDQVETELLENKTVDYQTIRELSKKEILAAFQTPPPVIGDYEAATLNNFHEAFKIWWLIRLFPLANAFFSAINTQAFWPTYGDKYRLWYDLEGSEIALLLKKDRAEYAKTLVDMGFPANLAAKDAGLDLPEVEGLSEPLQNLAVAGRINENG